ncbi:MAG TPA: thymidylate kinase [Candidatus Sulfotelmatobacter sp.]
MAFDNAASRPSANRPFLVTFSGIDGAGKTTQIEHLSSFLEKQSLRVLRLAFWDHVAVWSTIRAGVGHRSVDFRRAHSMAQRPLTPKNNKHVRKWYLTAARSGLYLLDVARLRRLLASQDLRNFDVIIFDRYIYDQIANVYSQSFAARTYGKILVRYTPTPDLAFVLDASPAAAFARKPEYPVEFLHQNRQNFLRLKELVPEMIIISDATEGNVRSEINFHISRARTLLSSCEENTEVTVDSAVVLQKSSCRVQNEPTANV